MKNKEEKKEKQEKEEKKENEKKEEKEENDYFLEKYDSEENAEDKYDKFFEEKVFQIKIFKCTGDIMIGITYLGRIVITLYTFHGLFFIYNIIFQYIILFAGLLFDINGDNISFNIYIILFFSW